MGVRLDRLRNREFVTALAVSPALATAPLLHFWLDNRADVGSSRPILNAIVFAAILSMVITALLVVQLRRVSQVVIGTAVGANGYLFFQWQQFDAGPYWLQYTQWIAVAVAVSLVAIFLTRHKTGKFFVLTFTAIVFALPGLMLLSAPQVSRGLETADRAVIGPRISRPSETPPNVYFILTDGYARADQLDRVLDYDETPFIADLARRGFEVNPNAFASYPATFLSVASILDMDHIATSSDALKDGEPPYYQKMQGDNAAVKAFHERGYTYIHAESGTYSASDCNDGFFDVCIEAEGDIGEVTISETERAVAELTPLSPLLDAGLLPVSDLYTDPQTMIGQLWQDRPTSPYFVFSHVVAPHPPHRRDADCDLLARTSGKLATGWKPEMRAGYVDSVDCLHKQLLAAIDTILKDDPTAIIVITGDHGSAFETPWGSSFDAWTDNEILERYATFHAARLPERCNAYDDPEAADNVVNSLRVVLACIDGEAPELRQPRAFFHRYGKDLIEFDDLTAFAE